MQQIRAFTLYKFYLFIFAFLFSLASFSFSVSAALPECNILLVPSKIRVESLPIESVSYSKGVKDLFNKEELAELTLAIVRKPIYALTEKPEDGFQKAVIAVLRKDNPVPQMVEIFFTQGTKARINIHNIPPYNRSRVRWFYDTISKGALPDQDRSLSILGGYLQGFQLNVHPETIVKLSIKHDVTLANVVMAFSKWSEGPVNAPRFFKKEGPPPVVLRYFFVSRIPDGRLIKVVFDWENKGRLMDDPLKNISLVSAYSVPEEDLIEFLEAEKEL